MQLVASPVTNEPSDSNEEFGLAHAESLMLQGKIREARNELEQAIERLPARKRSYALAAAGQVSVFAGDIDTAEWMAGEAATIAHPHDRNVVLAIALSTLSWTRAARGLVEAAVDAARQAVALVDHREESPVPFLYPRLALGQAMICGDRFVDAGQVLRAGLGSRPRRVEPLWTRRRLDAHAGLANAEFFAGRWDNAIVEASIARGFSATRSALLPCAILARIALARGDIQTAARLVNTATESPEYASRSLGSDWICWVSALLYESCGDICAAASEAASTWALVPGLHHVFGNRAMALDVARMAMAGGDTPLAEKVCEELGTVARYAGTATASAALMHCEGLLAADASVLGEAVATYRTGARPYDLARCCEDAAAAIVPHSPAEARALFREADTLYRDLGASLDRTRLTATARSAGLRLPIRCAS